MGFQPRIVDLLGSHGIINYNYSVRNKVFSIIFSIIGAGKLLCSQELPVVLRVGVYDSPPSVFYEEGTLKGIFPSVFDEIGKKLNLRFEYVPGTWSEIYEGVLSGKLDMIYDIAKIPERAQLFDFSEESVLSTWGVVFVRQGLHVETFFDLKGQKIALIRDDAFSQGSPDAFRETAATFGISCTYIDAKGYAAALKLVSSGKADAAIVNRLFADFIVPEPGTVPTTVIFKPVQLHIAFKHDSDLGKRFLPLMDEELEDMKADRKSPYYAALDEYLGNYRIVSSIPDWLLPTALVVITVLIFAVIVFFNIMLKRQVINRTNELAKANHRLSALSVTDPLTGIPNRRAFAERLDLEIERSRRSNAPLSLLMMDIDHFKKINDTFGHVVGDAVLCKVASAALGSVRAVDFVARYGGEEFAAILPGTDLQDALEVAEKIRVAVKLAASFNANPVTVTLGAAKLRNSDSLSSDLVNAADRALYRGKDAGRDRVVKQDDWKAPSPDLTCLDSRDHTRTLS